MIGLDWLSVALLATAALLIVLWTIVFLRSRRQDPTEIERRRRQHVNDCGRICEGRVLELLDSTNGTGTLVLYSYEVAGVKYQAAQDLAFLRDFPILARVAAGQVASIKFDPQNPSNSIIAAEEWAGL